MISNYLEEIDFYLKKILEFKIERMRERIGPIKDFLRKK